MFPDLRLTMNATVFPTDDNAILDRMVEDQNATTPEYIFNKIYIRAIFITLYSIVFCLCFFGK